MTQFCELRKNIIYRFLDIIHFFRQNALLLLLVCFQWKVATIASGNNRRRKIVLARTQMTACNSRVEIYSRLWKIDNSLYRRKLLEYYRLSTLQFIGGFIVTEQTSVKNLLPGLNITFRWSNSR